MCGITAITGQQDIVQVLFESIRNLEYRGYDSCGLGVMADDKMTVRKNIGGVDEVNEREHLTSMKGTSGIAHTRWATHGGVEKKNAHPHTSNDGQFSLVHNGIISNYKDLREDLVGQGVQFVSETDTEVIVQMMAQAYTEFQDVEQAFLATLNRLDGYYALALITPLAPGVIYAARKGSPLVLGLGEGRNFLASDVNAFLQFTREAVLLEDGEYVFLRNDGYRIGKITDQTPVQRNPMRIEWDVETSRKGGYAHYMLKEIFDQPQTITNALATPQNEVRKLAETIASSNRSYLMGVGTTHYVAMTGQYFFSKYAKTFLPAVSSDEFQDLAVIGKGDLLISISQSGETFDTRQGVTHAKEQGAATASIVNVMGSTLSMIADQVILQGSGPEICVVSTKAALAQMLILLRTALELGLINGTLTKESYDQVHSQLAVFPQVVQKSLNEASGAVRNLSDKTIQYKNWLFLGRGVYHAMALEAALKMKEVTYLHVEGLPAGFLKHGTLAMVDPSLMSLFFLPTKEEKSLRDLTLAAMEEVKARGGPIIGFLLEDDEEGKSLMDHYVALPAVNAAIAPLLELIMAQLFAYFSALKLGRSIDKPRNLAKSVTVG